MKMRSKAVLGGVLALVSSGLVASAPRARALAPATGGLWQIAYSARQAPIASVCISDPIALGQWEHRGSRCSQTIVSDRTDKLVISYTCDGGGMGRSEMTLLTPRTIRVATQGISGGVPFNYVLHARRAGACRPG